MVNRVDNYILTDWLSQIGFSINCLYKNDYLIPE